MLTSIIPVCITLLLEILGFIINTLIQRRTNSIQVITKNRIDSKEFDLYIRTDWSRIKVETVGKRKNGGIRFCENDYKQYLKYYSNRNNDK